MPYKLNKIIFQRDYNWGYETHTLLLNKEIDYPYAAGQLSELMNVEDKEKQTYEESNSPLFNAKGLTKLVPEVGRNGLYYLELRDNHKLNQLIVEPEEVVVDIFFGPKDTLIYSFYNPTKRNNIIIMAAIEKDKEDVYSQIKAEPEDLIWRQYFIKRALQDSSKSVVHHDVPKKPRKDILTSDEAANYLRIKKKTLQNYASEGRIKSLKGGKYRLGDLEDFLQQKKKK